MRSRERGARPPSTPTSAQEGGYPPVAAALRRFLCPRFSFCSLQSLSANPWLMLFFEFGPRTPRLWRRGRSEPGGAAGAADGVQGKVEALQVTSQGLGCIARLSFSKEPSSAQLCFQRLGHTCGLKAAYLDWRLSLAAGSQVI